MPEFPEWAKPLDNAVPKNKPVEDSEVSAKFPEWAKPLNNTPVEPIKSPVVEYSKSQEPSKPPGMWDMAKDTLYNDLTEGPKIAGEAIKGAVEAVPNLYKRAKGAGAGLKSLLIDGKSMDDAGKDYMSARGELTNIPVPWGPSQLSQGAGQAASAIGGGVAGLGAAAGDPQHPMDAAKDAYEKYQKTGPPEIIKEGLGFAGDTAMLSGVGGALGKVAGKATAPITKAWGIMSGAERDAAFAKALADSGKTVDIAGKTLNREIGLSELLANKASGKLEALSQPTDTGFTKIGEATRGLYEPVIEKKIADKKKITDPMYSDAVKSGRKTQKAGGGVDVRPVADILGDAKILADGLPGFEKISKGLEAILENPDTAFYAPTGKAGIPKPPLLGKDIEHLALTSRWMKEVGYSGELLGYPGKLKRTFLKAAKALDGQIQVFEPKFKAANDMYREMSIAHESDTAFLGRTMLDTEGGRAGNAMPKITPGDIPALVFEDQTRIAQLKEAVAGGKKASTAAKEAASKKVDNLVIDYYSEKFRTSSGQQIMDKLKDPAVSDTLVQVPGAQKALEKMASEKMSLAEKIDRHSAKAGDMRSLRTQIDELMDAADSAKKFGDTALEFQKYKQVLAKLKGTSIISASDFDNIAATIKNTAELTEKTKKYRNVLRWTMWSAPAAGGLGYGIRAGSHLLGGK